MANPEEFQHQQPTVQSSEPKRGAWTKFDWYQSPSDPIVETLQRIRTIPAILQRLVPQDSLPDDVKQSKLLQLNIEVRALMKMGAVGDEVPYSIVTTEEFLTIAPEIFGLDEEGLRLLREDIIPSSAAWLSDQIKQEQEEKEDNAEARNRFLLETWGIQRFDVLVRQLASISQNQIPNLDSLAERFQNIHRGEIDAIGLKSEEVEEIDVSDNRREQLRQLAERLKEIIGQLTFLTNKNISEISENEHRLGYLFLDTLKDALPTLYNTAAIAKKHEGTLDSGHISITRGSENALLDKRDEALQSIVYGAKDNHSVRPVTSRILKRGKKTVTQYNAPKSKH